MPASPENAIWILRRKPQAAAGAWTDMPVWTEIPGAVGIENSKIPPDRSKTAPGSGTTRDVPEKKKLYGKISSHVPYLSADYGFIMHEKKKNMHFISETHALPFPYVQSTPFPLYITRTTNPPLYIWHDSTFFALFLQFGIKGTILVMKFSHK